MIQIKRNAVGPQDFLKLYQAVGWGSLPPPQIERALSNSLCVYGAYYGKELVGMARLCGDNAMTYYLKDLIVLPSYQKMGIGRLLVRKMEEFICGQIPQGWFVSLELMSAKGKEPFYRKLGFEKRSSRQNGAGMTKIIEKR